MKLLVVFALSAALLCATAANTNAAMSLAEMSKSPFGAAILNAVQLNAAAGYDAAPIVNVVNEIVDQLNQIQASADGRNVTNQARCDSNTEQFRRQIEETSSTIQSLKDSIKQNSESLVNDNASLDQANSDYDNAVSSIEKGTAERNDSNRRWIESDAEVAGALEAIDEATKLIQHLVHGVSFAQVKSRYEKVLVKLAENKSKHTALFKPLILALSQLSAKLNIETVQKILALLGNLRQALTDSKNDAVNAESQSASFWAKLLEQLQNNKQHASELKARYASSIETLKGLLEQQKTSLENNQNSLENFQLQLQDETLLCEKQSEEYKDLSMESNKEIGILKQLVEHLENNFDSFLQLAM